MGFIEDDFNKRVAPMVEERSKQKGVPYVNKKKVVVDPSKQAKTPKHKELQDRIVEKHGKSLTTSYKASKFTMGSAVVGVAGALIASTADAGIFTEVAGSVVQNVGLTAAALGGIVGTAAGCVVDYFAQRKVYKDKDVAELADYGEKLFGYCDKAQVVSKVSNIVQAEADAESLRRKNEKFDRKISENKEQIARLSEYKDIDIFEM